MMPGGKKKPKNNNYTNCYAADIFPLGIILYLLTHMRPPFSDSSILDEFYSLIEAHNYDKFFEEHKSTSLTSEIINVSTDLRNLLGLILSHEPELRPTLNEIENHPWLQSDDISDMECMKEIAFREYCYHTLYD